jgi:hypothetical protein
MKWKNLKYEQKIKFLITGASVMLILCYQYGLKKTWISYNEYKENKIKTDQLSSYVANIPSIQNDEKIIDGILKNNIADTLNSDRQTLAFITFFCKKNKLWLTDYQPIQVTENSNFNIATTQVTIGGSYINILKLLFEIENLQSYGRLCSVLFKSNEDLNSGKIILKCTFYLQNLIRK